MASIFEYHKRNIEKSKTKDELLDNLTDSLIDIEMNEIGGAFYSGQGVEIGLIALKKIDELKYKQEFFLFRAIKAFARKFKL